MNCYFLKNCNGVVIRITVLFPAFSLTILITISLICFPLKDKITHGIWNFSYTSK